MGSHVSQTGCKTNFVTMEFTSSFANLPEDAGHLLQFRIHKMDGEEFRLTVRPTDRISDIIARLSEQSGIESYRIELAQGACKLEASASVQEIGLRADLPLQLVIRGPCPECARALGLNSEHPALLREWFARHQLEEPEWLQTDEAVWRKLEEELSDRERRTTELKEWETHAKLFLPTGEPANSLRARPGETVHCRADVWTHNHGGDTCIQQGLLGLDATLAAELCNGVPRRGKRSNKELELLAPSEPGAYMLWTNVQLQYDIVDARHNFGANCRKRSAQAYPRSFVGWLVVEAAA
mmetsp:Transcript_2755/g.6473  ORF Transcript_2755/g.6473 Transcript_2755/m.6473 type:complete len:296 (-) Transcript_2755:252-1139(-)